MSLSKKSYLIELGLSHHLLYQQFVKTELVKDGLGFQKGTECLVIGKIQEDARGPLGRSA